MTRNYLTKYKDGSKTYWSYNEKNETLRITAYDNEGYYRAGMSKEHNMTLYDFNELLKLHSGRNDLEVYDDYSLKKNDSRLTII